MRIKQKTFWWVDLVLFVGFLVTFFMSFTGVELHQWIGIFGGLLATYHLLAHWDWVDVVSRKIFGTVSRIVRLKFWVDGVMLAGFALILGTGLVISSWLNFSLNNYNMWLSVHILASITTLLTLLVKLVLHWRWISKTTRDIISSPVSSLINPSQMQPVPIDKRSTERRDFLRVMGIVAGGSLLALMSATKSLVTLQGGETNATSVSGTYDSPARYSNQSDIPQSLASDFSLNGRCSIQCGKRCSYPGHCRRYTDSNNNNYCDFGECT